MFKLTQPMIGAIFGSLLAAVPFIFAITDKNLDRDHKQQACLVFIGALSLIWTAKVHAAGKVEAAQSSPAVSPVQVNTADTQAIASPQGADVQQMFQDVWNEIATIKKQPPQQIVPRPPVLVAPRQPVQVTGNTSL